MTSPLLSNLLAMQKIILLIYEKSSRVWAYMYSKITYKIIQNYISLYITISRGRHSDLLGFQVREHRLRYTALETELSILATNQGV